MPVRTDHLIHVRFIAQFSLPSGYIGRSYMWYDSLYAGVVKAFDAAWELDKPHCAKYFRD